MSLKLPDVTLVMLDTRRHDAARYSVLDSLRKAEFGEVLILSDRPVDVPGAVFHHVDEGTDAVMWQTMPHLLRTSHMLLVQWDSGIIDPGMWTDDFLRYDWVGAPWWFDEDNINVGNGGFPLISRELIVFLWENRDLVPVYWPSDALICRVYRPALEHCDFKWPDPDVALDFSFENVRRSASSRHFGFHGFFNWPHVYGEDEVRERMALCGPLDDAQREQFENCRRSPFPWFQPKWRQRP